MPHKELRHCRVTVPLARTPPRAPPFVRPGSPVLFLLGDKDSRLHWDSMVAEETPTGESSSYTLPPPSSPPSPPCNRHPVKSTHWDTESGD